MKQKNDFHVVGIGASAGGLDAVQQLFDHIPGNTGVAFVIIQHLSPDFKSLMPELLAKHTSMEIFTAENNQEIRPNCIYLNQRKKNIGIKDNKFILFDKAPKDHLNLPIDILFHMLGESYRDKAIGVILSGTGSDGSRGIKTIKEAGGTILVQDPESAQFNGMPNSAILTNLPDFVLPPKEIAEKIVQYTSKRLYLDTDSFGDGEVIVRNEKIFQAILYEIQKHAGVNFKKYKVNTLLRRLEKRMSLHNIDSLAEYLPFLKENEKERAAINQEFLIGVTSFFRDKEAFDTIRNKVVPAICQQKGRRDMIRIWIPGCSGGEEVYSIAILFDDYIRSHKLELEYKIFATDIDKKALQQASLGSYPVNNCAEIEKPFLEEYFLKSGEKIQIIKRIRERVVFSFHDVTSDPPFIKVDLISCRNLLIYFINSTQKSVLAGFQYALNKDGFLFLGSSESLGSIGTLFKTLDVKHKIFQNIKENKRPVTNGDTDETFLNLNPGPAHSLVAQPHTINLQTRHDELFFYKYLSRKHAPVSVFIDGDFTVRFLLGDFKKWYNPTDGVYANNLLNMVPPELGIVIRNSIRRLKASGKPVSITNMVYTVGDEQVSTDLFFEFAEGADSTAEVFLVQFGPTSPEIKAEVVVLTNQDITNFSKHRIEGLEYELKEARAQLQNVIEELETSNEELQSANEELMSSNEELQSSNEELQSVNEELYTVNTEFQEKNKELENLNNDTTNLLNSTDIGTLFLDVDLNIRKFTPAVKRIFHLEEKDIGRSLLSFASEFEDSTRKSIVSDSKTALEELISVEKEVKDSRGNWYLKRVSPFITSDKKIEGVVITFVDINNLKKAKFELSDAEAKLTIALEAGKMAWWEMKLPSGEVTFNKNKAEMIGRNPNEFKHYKDFMAIVHPDDYNIAMNAMRLHLEGKTENYECQYRIKNKEGEYQWFQDTGKIVEKNENETIVSGIVIEVTAKKQTEIRLLEAIQRAETANVFKNQFLANMSHEIRTPMNGLVGFASLLREEGLDAKSKNDYIDIIESSSKQLLNLINDIIDISKIEAGQLRISTESCHLDKLIGELETTFNELKHRKGKDQVLIKSVVTDPQSDLTIKTDPARLKQVLTNLIGNSLKFTDEGSIEFGYMVVDHKIEFKVSDTGIGMSKDKLDIIFERFQQLEHSEKAIYDGTGLGLAISKGIITLLGGEIAVESKVGKGSVFSFSIPYIPADSHKITPKKLHALHTELLHGKQILVADDDYTNRLFIHKILKDLPLNILWASNGAEAVELFRQNSDISLVLMDIRMPILDGYKAAKEIFECKPDAKIIAQTAYAMSSDREKCMRNGFIDYISKPLQRERLLEIMVKWID